MKKLYLLLTVLCFATPLYAQSQIPPPGSGYVSGGSSSSSGGTVTTSSPLTGDGSPGSPITLPTTANPQINALNFAGGASTTSGDIAGTSPLSFPSTADAAAVQLRIGKESTASGGVEFASAGGAGGQVVRNGGSGANGNLIVASKAGAPSLTLNTPTNGITPGAGGMSTAGPVILSSATGLLTLTSFTVATLPATCTKGVMAQVSDAATTVLGTCTGGGSNAVPVICTTTNTWLCL